MEEANHQRGHTISHTKEVTVIVSLKESLESEQMKAKVLKAEDLAMKEQIERERAGKKNVRDSNDGVGKGN
eukprot:10108523-Ditylum_brightwellii.AAC.1